MEIYLPDELRNQEMQIPQSINKIFASKGIDEIPEMVKVRGKDIEITYKSIIGNSLTEIPLRIEIGTAMIQRYFSNEFKDLKENKKVITELSKIYNIPKKNKYTKHLMTNGATLPAKISFESDHGIDIIYAKKANFRRILGALLYTIISDSPGSEIKYNNKLILETHVKGKLASRVDERAYLSSDTFCWNLGATAARCDYLGMASDISHPKNRLIMQSEKTALFDFDTIFMNNDYQWGGNPIIDFYSNFKGKNRINKSILNGFKSEQEKIAQRLEDNIDLITELSNESGNIILENNFKLNREINRIYGEPNLLIYTKEKINHYRD